MSESVQGTPNPSDDELRAIAKRGRDAYSLATDNGWSERESNLAAYESLYEAGRVAGLEEAATIATESQRRINGIGTDGYTSYITEAVWPHAGIEIARAIRARLGDTGTENHDA